MKNPVERLADTLIHGDSQKAALVFSEKNRRYFTQFPATDGFAGHGGRGLPADGLPL